MSGCGKKKRIEIGQKGRKEQSNSGAGQREGTTENKQRYNSIANWKFGLVNIAGCRLSWLGFRTLLGKNLLRLITLSNLLRILSKWLKRRVLSNFGRSWLCAEVWETQCTIECCHSRDQ